MKKLLTAAALLLSLSPAAAQWQTPAYSVPVGRGAGNTGFDNAAPGAAGIPLVSGGATAKPVFAPVQNNGIAPGAANTMKGTLNGTTTSDIALTACTLTYQITKWVAGSGWQCGFDAVLPSRTVAATLDLSAFQAVRTLGYATPGDGGEATMRKTSGTLKDAYITGATIAGGSGYANSTYDNVPLTGGSSNGCNARVVTSGGAVTQVLISIPCGGYAVGDVLSTTNSFIGNGTGFTYTITSMTTPQGSFTDAAANKWQIDTGGWPNVRQYGAKLDWNGTDGSATNDRAAYMSAIAQAAIPFSTAAAIVSGGTILVPRGNSLICGGANGAVLPIPKGVVLKGSGVYGGSVLKFCTAESAANHLIQLCDIYVVAGEFGCAVKDLAIVADGPSNANIAAIYSISGQQFPLVDNVYIQPGNRGCVYYDFGKGGAANAIFQNFDCENLNTITNASFVVGSNVGGTQVIIENAVFGCAPTLCTHTAVSISGGEVHMSKVHIEGTSDGILVQNTQPSSFRNINVVSPCTTGMTLSAANPNGVTLIEQFLAASCTTAIVNGHAGGAAFLTNVIKQITCNPGAPCN